MKILSSFTHPLVVANLYEFLSSDEHKERDFIILLLQIKQLKSLNTFFVVVYTSLTFITNQTV